MSTMQSAQEALARVFGFPEFRAGQQAVIERLLAGRSVLSIFPTGAGKSLCYQLPALLFDGLTIVISPLIALMKDQIDFLQSKGIAAARLDSTLDFEQSRQIHSDLTSGQLRLLYVAPERFSNERFLQTLSRLNIAMLAVDEAHCISEWGHNFRPDYMKLADLARQLQVARVLALTATATPSVAADIARSFAIDESDIVKTPFHRPNLELRVTPMRHEDRRSMLLERIRSRAPGPTIVYVTLQKTAEEVAAFLEHQGLAAKPYHAGLDNELRHQIQEWFMASDEAIVVATIAFGMGIDKRNIRYVYHFNLPKSLESYAQEIGRAGRDFGNSICEILAAGPDQITLENFTYGDTPTVRSIHALLDELLSRPTNSRGESTPPGPGCEFDISVYDLSGRYDIRPLVVDTILTYLELDGVIVSTGPFYNEYKFQPQKPSAQILAKFAPERARFLRAIFQCAQPLKKWFRLDISQAMAATASPRQRVVGALNFLEEQGDLVVQLAGARHGYRMLKAVVDLPGLSQTMASRFLRRETRDIERVRSVIDFINHDACRTAAILNYFGESLDEPACGHCDTCLGQRPERLMEFVPRELSDDEKATIKHLRAQRLEALATPRQMTRFLCGLGSPAQTRAGLKSDPRFGMLNDIPFGKVLAMLSA